MKRELKVAEALMDVKVGLDGVIKALGGIPQHPKTIVTYQDGSIVEYDIRGTLEKEQIASMEDAVKIDIGTQITSIGEHGLYQSENLIELTIPSTVTNIESTSIASCSGLKRIIIDLCNKFYDSRDNCNAIIKTANNELIFGCKNTIIPNSVTSIGNNAFSSCSGLTSITIPDSVTSISGNAFDSCNGLTSITIPNGVKSIGNYAFYYCSGLTTISIGNGVTSIGDYTFGGCSSLTSITIGNGVTSIGNSAFLNCSGLTSVTIPDSVTSIGSDAFYWCSRLTSIMIGNGVTNINDDAFYHCSNLSSITIGNSVTSIGNGAFAGCSGLSSLTIPGGVSSIGTDAFYNCPTTVTFEGKDKATVSGMTDYRWSIGINKIVCTDGTL